METPSAPAQESDHLVTVWVGTKDAPEPPPTILTLTRILCRQRGVSGTAQWSFSLQPRQEVEDGFGFPTVGETPLIQFEDKNPLQNFKLRFTMPASFEDEITVYGTRRGATRSPFDATGEFVLKPR